MRPEPFWRSALMVAQAKVAMDRSVDVSAWARNAVRTLDEMLGDFGQDRCCTVVDSPGRAQTVATLLRERVRARLEASRFVPSTYGFVEEIVKDLAVAENLESSTSRHQAVPVVDSVWLLLESGRLVLLRGESTFREKIAELCLDKALEAASLCEMDSEGAAGVAPIALANEALLRAVVTCLFAFDHRSSVRTQAMRLAQPLMERANDLLTDPPTATDAAYAQLCAALLNSMDEGAWPATSLVTRAKAVELMCCFADRGLSWARARYEELASTGAPRSHLDFRADRTALFRTHLEAHLWKAWEDPGATTAGSQERTLTGAPAQTFLLAVFDNRQVVDVVERRRLGEAGREAVCADPTAADTRRCNFFSWLRDTGNSWLEIVVGVAHRAEILVRHQGDVIARIRRIGWTEDGLPEVICGWQRAHLDFHSQALRGTAAIVEDIGHGPFAGVGSSHEGTRLGGGCPLAVLAPIAEDTLGWIRAHLDSGAEQLLVCPDSVLHDVPWVSVGAHLGVQVVGQALSWATVETDAPRLQQREALFVLAQREQDMVAAYGGRDEVDRLWIEPLVEEGWTVHTLAIGQSGDEEPTWRCSSLGCAEHLTLRPSLVVWITHGGMTERERVPWLLFHGGALLTPENLVQAADSREPIALPGLDTKIELSGCRAFLSGACMSGRTDPRFGPEGVGLIRGLMALGVDEVYAPMYPALLTELPITGHPMRTILRALIMAAIKDEPVGNALAKVLMSLRSQEPGTNTPPLCWWWGHSAVFCRSTCRRARVEAVQGDD